MKLSIESVNRYGMQWSSATPGLLIFLTDQSEKSVNLINRLIWDIIYINFSGSKPKNRSFILISDYSGNMLISGNLRQIDENPKGKATHTKSVIDGSGGTIAYEVEIPIWIDAKENPIVDYAKTSSNIYDVVIKWIDDKPNNPSPIIIDVFDSAFCGTIDRTMLSDVSALSCQDGKVLLFGCDLSEEHNDLSQNVFNDKIPEQWIHISSCIKEDIRKNGIMRYEDLLGTIRLLFIGGHLGL